MSTTIEPTIEPPAPVTAGPPTRASRRALVAYGALIAVAVVLSATVPPGLTQVRLAASGDRFAVPDFAVPGVLGVLVPAVLSVAAAGYALTLVLKHQRVPVWVPATSGVLLVLAFLMHLAAGKSAFLTLTGLLASTLFLATPLLFGALGGVVCERVGIVNIAIEGQLLAGAFLAAVVASITMSPYLGLIGAPVAGALVGVLLALFSIRFQVNQVIVGVVLNVLVLGLTSFFFKSILADVDGVNQRMRLPTLPIPLLSDIPVIGPVLFRQSLLVYLLYALVIGLQIYLFRSRWGLRVRAVGEHPKAADTVGIDVNRTRWRNTILGSAIAGLGGAYFTIASGLAFGMDMTGGRGFIALAALILGRWSPKGALAAALFFGFAETLGRSLSTFNVQLDSNLVLMLPYIITIFAVAGFAGRVRPPAAEGIPYTK